MRYVLTGHKGLIGKEILYYTDGDCVLKIDKKDKYPDKIEADLLVHCAANCRINKTIKNPDLAFENVRSTYEALEFCRSNDIKFIMFFSSSRILSKEKNPYTASKMYGEELCKAYSDCYGISYIIIRPSTVFAKGDKKRLIPIWINNAKKNKDLVIYGDKKKTLSFTHLDDFMEALCLPKIWNRAYNIAGDEITLYKVAKEIIKQTKSKSKIVFKPAETAQPQKVGLKNKVEFEPMKISEAIKRCI